MTAKPKLTLRSVVQASQKGPLSGRRFSPTRPILPLLELARTNYVRSWSARRDKIAQNLLIVNLWFVSTPLGQGLYFNL